MNGAGNHYPLQTNKRTENQTPHVLTHRQVFNIETQGGEYHTLGSVGGLGAMEGTVWGRDVGKG